LKFSFEKQKKSQRNLDSAEGMGPLACCSCSEIVPHTGHSEQEHCHVATTNISHNTFTLHLTTNARGHLCKMDN